jgi:hypothetical protein
LHDGQVDEFKKYGFIEKEVSDYMVVLGNNVIHKHILDHKSNIIVLKYRPIKSKTTYKSGDCYKNIGNINDLPVSPCPY